MNAVSVFLICFILCQCKFFLNGHIKKFVETNPCLSRLQAGVPEARPKPGRQAIKVLRAGSAGFVSTIDTVGTCQTVRYIAF